MEPETPAERRARYESTIREMEEEVKKLEALVEANMDMYEAEESAMRLAGLKDWLARLKEKEVG